MKMKLFSVSTLLCAMTALTTAATLPDKEVSSGAKGFIPRAKRDLIKTSGGCPHGWTEFRDRCFVYVPTSMTWPRAERNCLSMDANLVSVHSSSEYHMIQKMTAPHGYQTTWVGGTNAPGEHIWFWSDGRPFQYTNWCPGEPISGSRPFCLQINYSDGKCWDDVWCDNLRPSVCAKKRSGLLD
ncbi:ladderlectin-like [Haplochromis burtoni]|uniref:ladderlectin-like n=1 Tax=Haplochromis burtoni TaxID=8153 RepID=UPI001C2D22C1|nr:ladderlectin-like [Haplochromis burtoni]